MLTQGHDLDEVSVQRIVPFSHRHVIAALGSAQYSAEASSQACAVGRRENGAELLHELVGARELAVQSKERLQSGGLIVVRAFSCV